jgi:predicted transcriptional regulator
VKNNMKPPCELVVSKFLPVIRASIVKVLINEYKMKQLDVSNLLGMTQGSVSQYVTSIRAGDERLLELFPEIQIYARELAKKIVQGEIKCNPTTLCNFCNSIRNNGKFCDYHKEIVRMQDCKTCFE